MVRLFSKKLVAFLMIFVLLIVMISSFNLTQPYALNQTDDSNISYDEDNNPYRTGQLIIGYHGNSTADEKRSIRATMQLELKANLNSINAEVITVKNERANEVLSNLKKNPNVKFAEYDYLAYIDHIPNDVRYPYQVYLHYMNASEAWDYSKGSPDITVAVLDTGILTSNTDLNNINVSGYNIADSNSDYTDYAGHGTGVISVIAAEMDNSFGFAGVAPECSFKVLKVIDEQGYSTYSDLIRALEYATTLRVDVINMSVSGRSDSLSLKLAIDNAYNSGITIVAAAGNESSTTVSFPAAYDNVVGVGAVNTSGDKMTFSNTGNGLTVVAGGSAMIATSTDYITSASGTSFASPYVAGLIALMYSVDDNMTPSRVFDILEATSTDLGSNGYDTTFGYGVINMGEAVAMASGNISTPASDTTPPVLILNGDSQMSLEVGSIYNEPGAQATDDIDGDISNNIVISGTVDVSSVGFYPLNYSVIDQAGNQSNIEVRIVEVIEATPEPDTTPPLLTLNGDRHMILEVGSTYNEPGAQAIDNFDGDISNDIVISGTVDVLNIGFYSLDYSVTDQAGNQSNIEVRTVEVIETLYEPDITPPILTLNGDSQMSIEIGSTYNEPGAQAIDDVDGDISNDIVISGTVDVSNIGFYSLDYSVTDQAGNQSNVETRIVEVFEYTVIPDETHFVRDVEIVKGSLSKRNPEVTHVISITDPGQLDVELTFTGNTSPDVSIDNLNFEGTSGTFDVSVGDYNMIIKSESNVKYAITITHPEREVPVGVPAGLPDIITYEDEPDYSIYIYIAIVFLAIMTALYIVRKRKLKLINHK
ncbi:MAG: DUF5011 domain-containing protein [Clostridiales bacterium]|nr:DUF5011 domain-containing protein [Clostridiales bacterium]